MARSPFSLFKRRSIHVGRYIYYVQFRDPVTHRYGSARSICKILDALGLDPMDYPPSSKAMARMVAMRWMHEGKSLEKKREPTLGSYCLGFWDWETSEYVKGCKLRNRSIGKEYVLTNNSFIRRYLVPHRLGSVSISDVTTGMLEKFVLSIKDEFGLANKSCNAVAGAIGKALNEAARTGLIKESPAVKVLHLDKGGKRRGILSSKEISDLFSMPWDDERVRIASLVSLTCGLRLGEILAIRRQSLGKGCIIVNASLSKIEGIKSTKNKHVRIVPIPEEVHTAVMNLIEKNPFKQDYAFWGRVPDVPMWESTIAKEYIRQLEKIGIKNVRKKKGEPPEPQSRQARNISFHSLRHLFNTLLRGAIPDEMLRESTGHLTAAMTDHYDHSEHDTRLKETESAVRLRILPLIQRGPNLPQHPDTV